MAKYDEIENMADEFLREHDSYYTDTDKWKRRRVEYMYLTPKQLIVTNRNEIQLSNLSNNQKMSATQKNYVCDYDEVY